MCCCPVSVTRGFVVGGGDSLARFLVYGYVVAGDPDVGGLHTVGVAVVAVEVVVMVVVTSSAARCFFW